MRCRIVAVLALLLATRAASAQVESGGILNRSAPGFRLGSSALAIHLGLSTETGYDSNVFYLPDRPVGAGLLRFRAHIDLNTQPPVESGPGTAPAKLAFQLSTTLEYREYLSGDALVRAQRAVIFGLSANLTVLPEGPFTLTIQDRFLHTVDPPNLEIAGQYVRDLNVAGLAGAYRRGRLEVGIGDQFTVSYWENQSLQFGNFLANDAQAFVRLHFLPQTVASLVARVGYVHFQNRADSDSIPFRVLLGGSTLFTRWFGVAAALGYGNSFNRVGPSFNHVLAQAELRFFLPYGGRITPGYDRDFHESLYANYFVDDRLYLAYDQPVVRRLVAHLESGVRFRHYEGLIDPTLTGSASYSSTNRNELVYDAQVALAYRPRIWLQVGVSYGLQGSRSDFAYVRADGVDVRVAYIKHVALAQLDLAY